MAEVLVFTMIGCPACYQLKPVAQRVGAHYASCVETKFIDVDRESALADSMGVEETPTVIGVNSARQPIVRMVGYDGGTDRIVKVYAAVLGGSCSVGPYGDV